MPESAEPSDAEVEAVIAEFGGDLRAAIRALLHDIAVLATGFAETVSYGYVRGRAPGDRARHAPEGEPRSGEGG